MSMSVCLSVCVCLSVYNMPYKSVLLTETLTLMSVVLCIEFVIERLPQHGGNITFTSYEQLEAAFSDKVQHLMNM